jgi:hypothetical protein
MSVFISRSNSENYNGKLKVATAAVAPGDAVFADDSAGTCYAPASDGVGDSYDLFLVANYDPYAETDQTSSKDFTVGVDEYARLKPLSVGDEFVTDRFIGTYSSISVDDVFAVNGTSGSGTCGKWIAIASRTPVLRVKVVEKTSIYGQNALKFRVIAA